MTDTSIRLTLPIDKQEPDQRRFWGRAYIHTDADGNQVVDESGDVMDTPEAQNALEQAFYTFMKDVRSGDLEHVEYGAATVIEGFVVTKEKKAAGLFPDGMAEGIYLGMEAAESDAGEALWEGVKSGRLSALSIVGTAEVENL